MPGEGASLGLSYLKHTGWLVGCGLCKARRRYGFGDVGQFNICRVFGRKESYPGIGCSDYESAVDKMVENFLPEFAGNI
jgi:hypothetical protein